MMTIGFKVGRPHVFNSLFQCKFFEKLPSSTKLIDYVMRLQWRRISFTFVSIKLLARLVYERSGLDRLTVIGSVAAMTNC